MLFKGAPYYARAVAVVQHGPVLGRKAHFIDTPAGEVEHAQPWRPGPINGIGNCLTVGLKPGFVELEVGDRSEWSKMVFEERRWRAKKVNPPERIAVL